MGTNVILIGVSGGSGSGKTTFSRRLQDRLTDEKCSWIAQDRYYRNQPAELRGRVNYDHPDSIEFELLEAHLIQLKLKHQVLVPQYDFATHSRGDQTDLLPVKPVLILDGILILSQPKIRELLDMSFYIHTEESVRFERRLYRDVRERGRTPEGVREQFYTQVKPMHDQFVEPGREWADFVISGEAPFDHPIERVTDWIQRGLIAPKEVLGPALSDGLEL